MMPPLWKVKNRVPYDLAIPLLGTCPEELRAGLQKYFHISMFIAALFTVAKR